MRLLASASLAVLLGLSVSPAAAQQDGQGYAQPPADQGPQTAPQPPPPLPDYDQPAAPGEGYLWTPGYWAWDVQANDYYWVPGAWVLPPRPGVLWTPPYWAWSGGLYVFSPGYWGPTVGFYGGVDYGFGYPGEGFEGGYWRGGAFVYNSAVTNITNTNITNVYTRTPTRRRPGGPSFNGGKGGAQGRPKAGQATGGPLGGCNAYSYTSGGKKYWSCYPATSAQNRVAAQAKNIPGNRAKATGGRPRVTAQGGRPGGDVLPRKGGPGSTARRGPVAGDDGGQPNPRYRNIPRPAAKAAPRAPTAHP